MASCAARRSSAPLSPEASRVRRPSSTRSRTRIGNEVRLLRHDGRAARAARRCRRSAPRGGRRPRPAPARRPARGSGSTCPTCSGRSRRASRRARRARSRRRSPSARRSGRRPPTASSVPGSPCAPTMRPVRLRRLPPQQQQEERPAASAVTTPTGSSVAPSTVRAALSASTRTRPRPIDAGSTRRWSLPTTRRARRAHDEPDKTDHGHRHRARNQQRHRDVDGAARDSRHADAGGALVAEPERVQVARRRCEQDEPATSVARLTIVHAAPRTVIVPTTHARMPCAR